MRSSAIAICLLLCGTAYATEPATDAMHDDFKGGMVALGEGRQWKLSLFSNSSMALVAEFEVPDVQEEVAKPVAAGAGIVRYSSKTMSATFKRTNACRFNAKGTVYPYETEATIAKKTYKGCGYANWDRHIHAMMPAIDACIKAAKANDPVTFAVRESDGIYVRLFASDTETTICQIDDSTGTPKVVKALTGKNVVLAAGERDPIFYRAPAENPGGECYEAEKVKDKSGKFLGWIDTEEGC